MLPADPEPANDPDPEPEPGPDPVVRAPRSLVDLPEPHGAGIKTVLAVALLGGILGASLGAVGIGIVYATRPQVSLAGTAPARPPDASPSTRAAPATPDAGPAFALTTDAGTTPPAPAGPTYEVRQQRLGRGRTLSAVLRLLGITGDEAAKVTRGLRTAVNLRALQPSDIVASLRDPGSHELKRVEVRSSPTRVFAAIRNDDGTWRGERVEVTLSTVRVATAFRVEGSVPASVHHAGLRDEIIPRLAEVFTAVDLGTSLHAGDVVRVVVDEERLNGDFYRYARVHALDYRGALGRRRAYWMHTGPRSGDFFDATGRTYERGALRAPVPGARISSRFNPRRMHPILHVIRPHNGMDFAAPAGTPVYAAADGTVLSVGMAGPAGNLVRLSHPALRVETGYAHLSRFAPGIHAGQRVRVRQLVGYVGSTGRSTGPHLHFILKRDGRFLDPMEMYAHRQSVSEALRPEFDALVVQVGAELDRLVVGGEAPAAAPDAGPATAPVPTGEGPAEGPPTEDPGTDEAPLDEAEPGQ